MREWLTWPQFPKQSAKRKAGDLYGMVVAAARQPAFYGPGRVADTPEGRFELIALHLFLLAERLTSDKPEGEELARYLIEAFVTDMDDCMREMGVGDLTVPKRVKRAAAVFYERSGAYRDALAMDPRAGSSGGDRLSSCISAALQDMSEATAFSAGMADYMRANHAAFTRASYAGVAAGTTRFVPAALAAA